MIRTVPARRFFLSVLLAAVTALSAAAHAQDAAPPSGEDAKRLEVSRKLHDIRPASLQVESALEQVARSLPEPERQPFVDRMMAAIDTKRIEDVSIGAMARVFTLPELERMYEYFSTPEARGISDKMPIYQGMIQPEIMKMLDKAMMEMRTGASASEAAAGAASATPPPATPAAAAAPVPAPETPPAQAADEDDWEAGDPAR